MLKSFLLVLPLAYLGVAALAWLLADRLIFLPPRSSYAPGQLPIVHVPTEDGARIATLYLRNDSAAYTLLFSHGNAEDLGHAAPFLTQLRDRPCGRWRGGWGRVTSSRSRCATCRT